MVASGFFVTTPVHRNTASAVNEKICCHLPIEGFEQLAEQSGFSAKGWVEQVFVVMMDHLQPEMVNGWCEHLTVNSDGRILIFTLLTRDILF